MIHFQHKTVQELLEYTYEDYAYITAGDIAALSKDKMHAIHIDWLRPSALAGLTPDNITGITDLRYFREWISPAQMALINPAAIAALTYEQYLSIKLASMNALTDAQLNARNTAKGWFAVKTEVDRFKKLLGDNWQNVEPLNDPDFVTWFKRLPLGVIDAIITESNGAPGFGLNFSLQKLLSTNQISDSTGFSNGSLSKNSLSAIFKTIASESTQADISQFNVETIARLIYAMGNVQGDWVGIGDDGRWVWRLTEAQVSAVSKQYPAHGAMLYRLWIGPEGYEDYYLKYDIFVMQFQALSSLSMDELLSGFQFGQTPIGLKLPYQKLLTVAQIKNLSAKTLETLRAYPLPMHDKLGDAAPVLLWAHGKKNPQLTNALLQLTSADAQLLNANHMAILSELDLVYHIPESAIPGLTADAVAGLSAAQFNGSFTDLGVPLLKLTKVKSETFAAVNAKFISMLSTSQFASLTTDQLKALSDEAVNGVTVEQVNARYLTYFNGRILQKDSRYIIQNLDELVGKLRDTLIFKMVARYLNTLFPGDSRLTGTALVIPELSVKDVVAADPYQLKEWASNLTNGLRLIDSLKRFSSEDATKLRNRQVQALSGLMQYLPVQALSGLTSTVVGVISTEQLSQFSTEQVQQLNISQLSVSTLIAMGGGFINTLTVSQVQSLSEPTVTQLLGNSNGVIANLSPRFFQALSDTVLVNAIVSNPIHIQRILGQLSPAQIAALRPSAINGLITSHLFTARTMLDIGQTAVWTFDQFHAMTAIPGALALIHPNALANALSVDALLSLSPTEISQLTAQQYEALLNNLTLSKVIFNAGMGEGYWTVAQLQALAPNTVAYMTQDQYLSYANPLGLALFTSDQQAGMSTNVGLLEIFVTGQVNFWDQATMARIISTIPGMIPLSGLPGGGCGPSKGGSAPQFQVNNLNSASVQVLQALFMENSSYITLLNPNELNAIMSNPNLPTVISRIDQDNLMTIIQLLPGWTHNPKSAFSKLYEACLKNPNFTNALSKLDRFSLMTFLGDSGFSIAFDNPDNVIAVTHNENYNEALTFIREGIWTLAPLVNVLTEANIRAIMENLFFDTQMQNLSPESITNILNNPYLFEAFSWPSRIPLGTAKNYRIALEGLGLEGLINVLGSRVGGPRHMDSAELSSIIKNKNYRHALSKLEQQGVANVINYIQLEQHPETAQILLNNSQLQLGFELLNASGVANVINSNVFMESESIVNSMASSSFFVGALSLLSENGLLRVFNNSIFGDAVIRAGVDASRAIMSNRNLGAIFPLLSETRQAWVSAQIAAQVPFATYVSNNINWITLPMLQAVLRDQPNTYRDISSDSLTTGVISVLSNSPAGRFLLNNTPTNVVQNIGRGKNSAQIAIFGGLTQPAINRLVNGAAQFLNNIPPSSISAIFKERNLSELTVDGLIQLLTTVAFPGRFINESAQGGFVHAIPTIPPATLTGLNAQDANVLLDDFWFMVTREQLSAMMTSPNLGGNYFSHPDTGDHIRVLSLRRISPEVLSATYIATEAIRPIIRNNLWGSLSEAQQIELKTIPGFVPPLIPPNGDLLVFLDNPTLSNQQITPGDGVIHTPVHNASDAQLDLLTQAMAVLKVPSAATGRVIEGSLASAEVLNPPLRFASSAVH